MRVTNRETRREGEREHTNNEKSVCEENRKVTSPHTSDNKKRERKEKGKKRKKK